MIGGRGGGWSVAVAVAVASRRTTWTSRKGDAKSMLECWMKREMGNRSYRVQKDLSAEN